MSESRRDVVVIGCGPVGATAALLLADQGLAVTVVEQFTDVYPLPRAAHFDGEIMRVFQQIGLTDELLPLVSEGAGMHFVNAQGVPLLRFDPRPGHGAQGWSTGYFFHQPDLELVLRDALDREGLIDVRFGTTVVGVDASTETVTVRTDRGDVSARWVIACDGARSPTREWFDLGIEDLGFDQPWLVLDVVLKSEEHGVDLPVVCHQVCDPTRPTTFVPMPGRRRRWEFMVMPDDDLIEMTVPERARRLVGRWLPADAFEIERWAMYTFHATVARRWRHGRVFLAGDAAHQMPPFLGQGMCSGIRDAANLAWKLALVHRGEAPPALLDTYQTEREPHVRSIIAEALEAGSLIQTVDPEVAKARDEYFLAQQGNGEGARPLDGLSASLGPGLVDDSPHAGTLAPQLLLQTDDELVRLDELTGPAATLLVHGGPSDLPVALAPGHDVRLVAFDDDAVTIDGVAVAATPCALPSFPRDGAVLVRPDRYVFGTSTLEGVAALVARYEQALTSA